MSIDTRLPMGTAMAHMARVFAELERDPRYAIARDLNNDAVPTAQARAWSQATGSSALASADVMGQAES